MTVDLTPKPFPGETASDYESALQSFEDQGNRDGIAEAFAMPDMEADTDPFADERDFEDFPLETRHQSGFTICDKASAIWYLDKIAAINEKRSRYTTQFQEIMQGLDADEKRLKTRFKPQLKTWAMGEVKAQGRGKTLKLLAGSISFTHVAQSVRLVDINAALKEAQERFTDAVQSVVITKLDTAAYRKNAKTLLETTGELLPGCEIVPERESMNVKLGGKS